MGKKASRNKNQAEKKQFFHHIIMFVLTPRDKLIKQKSVEPFRYSHRTFWTNAKQEDRIVLHTRLIWSTMSIRSPPDQNRQTSGVSATGPLFLFVNCPDLLPRTAKTLSLVCIEHTAQCKVILNSAESKTFFVTIHFSATPHRTPSRADLVRKAFWFFVLE